VDDSSDNVFDEWRTADRKARALEKALNTASLASLSGHPFQAASAQELANAKAARDAADELFRLAMQKLDAQAKANRQ
jgi:hypothetical protein